jgi:2-methylisocitrate lyase-like PEP mutase family enzyme
VAQFERFLSQLRFSRLIYFSPVLTSGVFFEFIRYAAITERDAHKKRCDMKAEAASSSTEKQLARVEAFRQLHVPGKPIILYNIWDAGSAKAVAKSAKAIATSSWAVAKSHGFEDGERFPYQLAVQNLREIVAAVELPVTFDIESGYAEAPSQVADSISLAINAGAVGCNFEDSVPATGAIRDLVTQVARIQGARKAANAAGIPLFINARCDLFFQGDSVPHDDKLLSEVFERVHAYADAGADGLFVPGLAKISLISQLTKKSPIPVNILASSSTSLQVLAENGVARVSFGAAPYIEALRALEQGARAVNG